jgi:TolC family type I secretion outer membrane protein
MTVAGASADRRKLRADATDVARSEHASYYVGENTGKPGISPGPCSETPEAGRRRTRAIHVGRFLQGLLIGLGWATLASAAPATVSITEALGAAYLFSPALRSARHGLDVVNERRPQALAAWAPTVILNGTASRVQANTPTDAYRTGAAGVTSSLTLPITRGGGEFANLRQAEHLIRAQRALLLASEQVVLGQAAQAYMDVLLAQAVLRYRGDNRSALRRVLAIVLRQMRLGDRTAVDAGLAEARAANAEAQLAQARGNLDIAVAAYRQAIGQMPGSLVMPQPLTMLPSDLAETVRLAETSNPEVVAAQFQLLAARSDAEVQLAQLLPGLSLQVDDLRSSQRYRGVPVQPSGSVSGTTVQLVLSVPLYQGGAEYATVRIARKTALQRGEDLLQARLRSIGSATTAWRQRETAEATRQGFAASLAANERLNLVYQRLIEAGQLTILEVLNGLQDLIDAQINKATADHDRIIADFSVLNSVGGLTARTLGLPVPYYDPDGDYRRTRWRIFGLSVVD